ncbi:hypothetical protein SanaruYs_06770 [Chryseotalea sanaruensis]|uniref:Uncharacterized protein n=1 Tax=Chryseotalea sanaruensis TaxID=2482724 RepID=A0A401U6I1_9BACT|nr:hypothetical protein [Chryseotalea sanaruensis]GCC50462.1 hypothetical protein SanaruYs_06770 [Chryseotalea sanaruensis]
MKDYSDAIITGQLQTADATFSRITLVYYINHNNISKSVYGYGEPIEQKNLFYTITIPNSATINVDGSPKQGVPTVLDYQVPIEKDHNGDMDVYTLI